jgi:hypothetical protein
LIRPVVIHNDQFVADEQCHVRPQAVMLSLLYWLCSYVCMPDEYGVSAKLQANPACLTMAVSDSLSNGNHGIWNSIYT